MQWTFSSHHFFLLLSLLNYHMMMTIHKVGKQGRQSRGGRRATTNVTLSYPSLLCWLYLVPPTHTHKHSKTADESGELGHSPPPPPILILWSFPYWIEWLVLIKEKLPPPSFPWFFRIWWKLLGWNGIVVSGRGIEGESLHAKSHYFAAIKMKMSKDRRPAAGRSRKESMHGRTGDGLDKQQFRSR